MASNIAFRMLNRLHIFTYRRSKGSMWGKMFGSPVLLLTTTGRKTGKRRTVPVVYTRDGESYAVIATDNPGWYYNLKGNPKATIEVNGSTYRVTAREANAVESEAMWAQFIEKTPAFESQKDKHTHVIVMLEPAMGG